MTVHVTPAGGGTVEFNGTLYTSPISVLDDSKVSFEAIPADGYEFDASEALVNGKFMGLPVDEDFEPELTDERVKKWIEQLRPDFGF